MTPTKGMREEFEEAYHNYQPSKDVDTTVESHLRAALWAARWMAERCAKVADISISGVEETCCLIEAQHIRLEILKLKSELGDSQ